MSNIESNPELTDEQLAALTLINENPLLQNDVYAKKVVESGGLVDSGNMVDIGDFLAARLAVLEGSDEKVAAAKLKNPRAYDAAVVHSVAPHLERNLEE